MAVELITKAGALLKERKYAEAVEAFTEAAELDPQNPEIFLGRARAHNKLEQYLEAVADADQAVELDSHLAAGHKEKGDALYGLEEYESAKAEFEAASVLEPNKRYYKDWIKMCMTQLGEELPQEPANNSSLQEVLANRQLQAESQMQQQQQLAKKVEDDKPQVTAVSIDDPEYSKYWRAPVAPAAATASPSDVGASAKYRHQWFQSDSKVEINILAKGLPKDRVKVDITADHLKVTVLENASDTGTVEYEMDVPLYRNIDPEASKYEVLSTKVEIRLVKGEPGVHWASLESSGGTAAAAVPAEVVSSGAQPASVPYAYAGKKVDWEKIEKQAVKEEEEKPADGDAAVMKLFKKLFADGDDEMKRAMMKSYQESGGKALSTNWKEVAQKDYKEMND